MDPIRTIKDLNLSLPFGGAGIKRISDTGLHKGPFLALIAMGGDVTISTCKRVGTAPGALDGELIKEDGILYGVITDLELTSGDVDAVLAGDV